MNRLRSWACRLLVRIAGRLVPSSQKQNWDLDYAGPLWEFTLEAAARGTADSQFALQAHTRRALRSVFQLRFGSEEALEHKLAILGHPYLPLGLSGALLLALVIHSTALAHITQLARSLPYKNPETIVVLAQGPPVFGVRFGFRERELEALRTRQEKVENIAAYYWGYVFFRSERSAKDILAAEVTPEFFDVLGVVPRKGKSIGGSEEFVATYDFWERELRDPKDQAPEAVTSENQTANNESDASIGRSYEIAGHPMRLAGILPRRFSFLSAPISVFVAAAPQPPVAGREWWLNLRGAVARLRPGVTPENASKDLRQALVDASIARQNFRVAVSPIEDLVQRPLWSYFNDLFLALCAVLLWAAFGVFRDRRAGMPYLLTLRFWGFFFVKCLLPLLALIVVMLEYTSAMRLGVTGGMPRGAGQLAIWHYAGIVLILIWAWRDQPDRCRVCLERMRKPMRIGIPGDILLDTAGEEVMCPQGHGSVYTSQSVHGSDLSDRWMGFP